MSNTIIKNVRQAFLRKIFCLLLALSLVLGGLPAGIGLQLAYAADEELTWKSMGAIDSASQPNNAVSTTVGSNGALYVLYKDGAEDFKATVKTYDGVQWKTLGEPGFSAGEIFFGTIAVDGHGTPYVAYSDAANVKQRSTTVMKYDGEDWVNVGTAGFSEKDAYDVSLALDPAGVPYVAYRDGQYGYRATVQKYDGQGTTGWSNVGAPGFSAGSAVYTSIAIAGDGTPILAYNDGANNFKATVKKYDGEGAAGWSDMGSAFSTGYASYISLAVDGSDAVYVAYGSELDWNTNTSQVFVKKYDGEGDSGWSDTGAALSSNGDVSYISLKIHNGVAYLAYVTDTDFMMGSGKAAVKKYYGGSWADVGFPADIAGSVHKLALAIAPTGKLYVAYTDVENSYAASVMEYAAEAAAPETYYTATVDIRLNGVPADITGNVELRQSGELKYTAEKAFTGTYTASAGNGIYNVFAGGTDTGLTVNISNAADSVTVAYNTVSFAVTNAGSAAGSTVTATVEGNVITSGSWVPAGKSVIITASGAGAANYSYLWSGSGAAGETTAALSITSVNSEVNVSCTVTGSAPEPGNDSELWKEIGLPELLTDENIIASAMGPGNGDSFYSAIGRYDKNAQKTSLAVMKYDGSAWTAVGEEMDIPENWIFHMSLAEDKAGKLYLAYITYGDDALDLNSQKLIVKKYGDSGWTTLGTDGVPAVTAAFTSSYNGQRNISLAVSEGGVPYIAYLDNNGTMYTGPDSVLTFEEAAADDFINIITYINESWKVPEGSKIPVDTSKVSDYSIFVDKAGTPYLLCSEEERVSVKKYDGSVWLSLEGGSLPETGAAFSSMILDSSGTPYLVYMDSSAGSLVVSKYSGSSWVNEGYGNAGAIGLLPSLAIDGDGILYLSYSDFNDDFRVYVKKNDGTGWTSVGEGSLSEPGALSGMLNTKGGNIYLQYAIMSSGEGKLLKYNPPAAGFEAVESITGVSSTAVAGTDLTLSGTVLPARATNKTILWSVENVGSTGATLAGSVLKTTGAGTVLVKATITNGTADGEDYTQTFSITVGAGSNNNNNNNNNNSNSNNNSNNSSSSNSNADIIAAVTTATIGTQTVTTITVDEKKLEKRLAEEGNNAIVAIPADTKADVVIGELNGQMVKDLENKTAVLQLKTETATYSLPAQQINIGAVAAQLGQNLELKDIKIQVEIGRSSAETVKMVESTAQKGRFTLVAAPVDFKVTCSSGGKTTEVSTFNAYVERLLLIPEGIDPSKITTGIVVEKDGAVRHVPTQITVIDGKYYAVINSLTNSTYSVVWHPLEFADAANHWAKEAINDMGSRMVVSGVDSGLYQPDRDITRGEFAAIIVKALGLEPGKGSNNFSDVSSSAWYCEYIKTAGEYGIITGYGSGRFGPNDKITREQAMTMIAKAMKLTDLEAGISSDDISTLLAGFGDAFQAAAYAKESIAACVKTGIVSGKGGKLLAPKDEITRAEVAVMVRQLLKKSKLI